MKPDYEPIRCPKTGMNHRLPSDLLVCNCHVCKKLMGGANSDKRYPQGVMRPVFAWRDDPRFHDHKRPTCEICSGRLDGAIT